MEEGHMVTLVQGQVIQGGFSRVPHCNKEGQARLVSATRTQSYKDPWLDFHTNIPIGNRTFPCIECASSMHITISYPHHFPRHKFHKKTREKHVRTGICRTPCTECQNAEAMIREVGSQHRDRVQIPFKGDNSMNPRYVWGPGLIGERTNKQLQL